LNYDDTSGNILDLRVSLVTEGEFGIEVDTTSTDLLPIPYRQDGFRWSPDGTRIAYVDEASDMSQNLLQIVEVAVHREPMPPSIDILENTIWTRDHTNQSYELLEALAWSPDGEWLAYDKQTGGAPGGGKLMDLFIVRSDGTGLPINITNNSSSITSEGRYSSPDWNPLWVKNIDNP
jgi:Tol biopolymer transport system component